MTGSSVQVQSKQVELLQHPLVATLLNRKWAKFGAIMYILSLLLFVGLVIFITSFALAVPHPLSEACAFYTLHTGVWLLKCFTCRQGPKLHY